MIDFLVIGGGIAGISAAARLSGLGTVTLLEAEEALAYHASGRSAAMFEQSYGLPSTQALTRASRADHEAMDVFSDRGLMLLGQQNNSAAFDADMVAMNMQPLDLHQAREMVPILAETVTRVGYHAEAYDIDTDRLVQSFLRIARSNGAQITTRARVTEITRKRAGWSVATDGTRYETRALVNAAGPWADEIAALAGLAPIGVSPLRRSMARIAAPKGLDVARWPMLFGPGETWYAKPDAGALIVSPADEDPCPAMDAWAEDETLAKGIARYAAHVTEPPQRMLSNWAGLRTFSPDRQLVIGLDPAEPEFLWCAGQGGYGMQTAPAASTLLAEIAAGRQPALDPDIVAALAPGRFSRG